MKHAFLKPWDGPLYREGFKYGKKVLVLGASSYCNRKDCKFYQDCAIEQNSRLYDTLCPFNNKNPLSMMPSCEFDEDAARTFKRFILFMKHFLNTEDSQEVYNRVAFTNYVQHILGGRTNTLLSDCREEYLDAFVEVLEDLQPDIVLVWGCVINKPLLQTQKFEVEIVDNNDYIFKWKNFHGRDILFFNIYHPSSGYFYTDEEWDKMKTYFEKVLKL